MTQLFLVVEDELALRETLAYNLDSQDYKVEAVGDGQVALETARKMKPDLIVLDLMLPGMDGFAVTRALRKEMNVPILMLTARADEIENQTLSVIATQQPMARNLRGFPRSSRSSQNWNGSAIMPKGSPRSTS